MGKSCQGSYQLKASNHSNLLRLWAGRVMGAEGHWEALRGAMEIEYLLLCGFWAVLWGIHFWMGAGRWAMPAPGAEVSLVPPCFRGS